MPAEVAAMLDKRAALPMELRASLDVLFEMLTGELGVMRTSAFGEPSLVTALASYSSLEPDRDHLTFLGTSMAEIALNIERDQPRRVTVLGAGRLQRVLRPIRHGVSVIPRVPQNSWWASHGYQLIRSIKIQGAGSLFWTGCDRLLRRFDRPHLADRCRIAMLRTLVAARGRFMPAALLVQEFRRMA